MKLYRTNIVIGLLMILFTNDPGESESWSQWRGPHRDGKAAFSAKQLPESLRTIWSLEAGLGHSSPVVENHRVFLFSREQETEVARAVDLITGKVLWRTAYDAPYREYPGAIHHGRGPKSTPIVWQQKLFTLGINGILTCFDATSGKVIWQKDFTGKFPVTAPPFGTSMSPLIAAGMLIVHAGGHDGGSLLALDPATGDEKWSLSGDGPSYSSPIVVTIDKQAQIVIQVHRKILGVDLQSGRALWTIPFVTPCDQNIVTPVLAGDLIIFSSLQSGTFGIRVKQINGIWKPETVWHVEEVSMYMSSPVLVQNRLIGFSHKRQGQFFALHPETGKLLWTSGPRMSENAALVQAGPYVFALKEDAELLVLSADADAFRPTATYQVAKSETWAHPVPTDQGILIKDANSLMLLGG